jgi:hypothetical protein
MVDAIFVGFEDYYYDGNSKPLISFRTVEEATKWKSEKVERDFVLVELI